MANNYIPVTLENAHVGGARNYQSKTITLPSGYLSEISLASIGGSSVPTTGFLSQAFFAQGGNVRMMFTAGDYAASIPGIRCYGGEELTVNTEFLTGCQATSVTILVVVSSDPPAGSYLAQDYSRSYPRTISLAAPVAGADYADVTIDSAQRCFYRVLGIKARLTTDATVATRYLQVNGMPFLTAAGTYTVGASNAGLFRAPSAPVIAAQTVTFNTTNIQSGDQYGAGELYVEEVWHT